MKQRYESAMDVPLVRRDDINYPGVIMPVTSRAQQRTTVDYDTYVLRYAAAMRLNAVLFFAGAALFFAGVVWTSIPVTYFVAAVALGPMAGGAFGLWSTMTAHQEYRDMAVTITETYAAPPPAPKPVTVRPFVTSANGDGRTTNTGRLQFAPIVWQRLFELALKNEGAISKDGVAKPSGIGRRWYHSDPNSQDGFQSFLGELRQIGFIDERNRLTAAALDWYEKQIALPLSPLSMRPDNDRPTGPTDRPTGGAGGWE